MKGKWKYFLFVVCILFVCSVSAQTVRVSGKVIDADTGDALPYVNIIFIGTTDGGISDVDGNFHIVSSANPDSISVSFVGYQKENIAIKNNVVSNLKIKLKSEGYRLGEVIIRAGEDPALILLELIKEKRKNNKLKFLDYYSYDVYNKLEFDLNNLNENFGDAALLKPFSFLKEYIDTADISGKAYLPFFISEAFSQVYYSNKSDKLQEFIRASRVSGIENESLTRYTGEMYQDVDIYAHVINVFGRGFISPIGRMGKSYYNYDLTDTAWQDNRWCYKLEFKPKRKHEPTLEGHVWVNDTSFAVKSFKISLSETATINFVDTLVAEKHFIEVADSTWMIQYDNIFVDFNVLDSTEGFFGRKTTYYSNHKINDDVDKSVLDKKYVTNLIVDDDPNSQEEDYWDDRRPTKLTEQEKEIYLMVDTVKQVKAFTRWEKIITMLVSGYYPSGLFEIGPVFSFISSNPVEGNRLRLGLRTSNKFSEKIMLGGYGAYGFSDKEWKYGGKVSYMFNTLPRRAIHFNMAHDYIQVGSGLNAMQSDNLLATMLRRPGVIHLHFADQWEVLYEHEFFEGFSAYAGMKTQRIFSPPTNEFYVHQTGNSLRSDRFVKIDWMQNSEIKLGFHYAKDEKFMRGKFEQVSVGTKKPVINIDFAYAPKNFLSNSNEYIKLTLNYKHRIQLYPFGELHYAIEAGKIQGKAYYPFLMVHQGNQSFAFYDFSFNLMNYYEFVSDQYVSLYTEQHFEGFLFNHIPVMRRLHWREHLGFRATYGTLSSKNRDLMFYPEFVNDFQTEKGKGLPYMEANIGVSNIFKVLRLDAVWRLSHLKNDNIYPFAIVARLQFNF